MVSRGEYTSSRAKLGIDVLGKKNAGVFTISDAEEIELPDEDSDEEDATRMQVVLTFSQFPDEAYYLSRGDTVTLIDLLGEDEQKWIGKKIPLVKRSWVYKKKKGVSLRLADVNDWADIGVPLPRKAAPAKKARRATKKRR